MIIGGCQPVLWRRAGRPALQPGLATVAGSSMDAVQRGGRAGTVAPGRWWWELRGAPGGLASASPPAPTAVGLDRPTPRSRVRRHRPVLKEPLHQRRKTQVAEAGDWTCGQPHARAIVVSAIPDLLWCAGPRTRAGQGREPNVWGDALVHEHCSSVRRVRAGRRCHELAAAPARGPPRHLAVILDSCCPLVIIWTHDLGFRRSGPPAPCASGAGAVTARAGTGTAHGRLGSEHSGTPDAGPACRPSE